MYIHLVILLYGKAFFFLNMNLLIGIPGPLSTIGYTSIPITCTLKFMLKVE